MSETGERYVLEFDIPPDLYKRAITQPIPGRAHPTGARLALRTGLADAQMAGAIICICLALFDLAA